MENEILYRLGIDTGMEGLINVHLSGTTYPDENYYMARTRSKYAVIEYVESGRGTVRVDNKRYSIFPGDSYLLLPGKNHIYHSDPDEPWKKHFINVSGTLINKLIEAYELEGACVFPGLDLSGELSAIINAVKAGGNEAIFEVIREISIAFAKMHLSLEGGKGERPLSEKMRIFLDSYSNSRFRIEELCDFISRSESQTIGIFKKAYGITPYAYVMNQKISLAKVMLRSSDLSVKQIAYNLKFADEYYFSNAFKKKTGLSPTKYRQAVLKGEGV